MRRADRSYTVQRMPLLPGWFDTPSRFKPTRRENHAGYTGCTLAWGGGIWRLQRPGRRRRSSAGEKACVARKANDGVCARRGAACGRQDGLSVYHFVRWFGIPSPFAAALLLARAEKPTPLMLAGAGVSLAVRALWGLELDVWQYVGIAGLWLALRRCRPRPGIETAALGGLAMMPRVFAALAGQVPLDILLSLAAVPLGMLGAAFFRSAMDGMASTGAPTCTRERACVAALGLLLVGGTGYFWVGSLNLGQLTAVWVTVAYAAANGPVYGVAAGLLCGLSLALGGHDVRMAATLSVMGLLCGLPAVERRRWLFPPAAVAGWAVGYSLTPLSGPTVPFWAALAGAAAYALLPGWMLERVRALARGPEPGVRSMETAFVSQRIEHMRDALERLAKALPDPGSQAITSGEELGELLCARCANRELCWGKGRVRTERLLADMMDRVERGEAVDEDNLPALAEHGCLRAESIEETAQEALAALKRREAGIRKARYERELTLTHLAALSGTLGELSMMAGGESLNDLKAAHILNLALEELNVPARLSYARRVDGHPAGGTGNRWHDAGAKAAGNGSCAIWPRRKICRCPSRARDEDV